MNIRVIILGGFALAISATAAFGEAAQRKVRTPEQLAEVRQRRLERTGGDLIRRGTFAGKVAIVNAQTRLPDADCAKVAAMFAKATDCNIAVAADGTGAQVVVTVIDDPKEPTMLLAPEDHWGKVNVAKLVDDLPGEGAKVKFFGSRARKMIAKALSILCGGGASSFPGNIMNAATLRDLDAVEEQIPVDQADKYMKYLARLGVTRKEMVTYYRACKEGWAPAPTNDIQRRVWEKTYDEKEKGPANAIRITPPNK